MKKIIVLFSLLICFAPSFATADEFKAKAEHAIAVEANTGKILYEKDATTPDAIASITKILTVYMVYQEIDKGNLTWDTEIDISDYPYHLTVNPEASNVPMEARKYTVRDLVNAAMVASANSAAIALAEHIGGSEPKFVDMMSQQLKDWGIKDAKLVNASGLNNEVLGDNIYPDSKKTDENMMSAKDVAIIAQHIIEDYPDLIKVSQQGSANFDGNLMTTYNYMLEGMPYYRASVDGLKTGTTKKAGASFVATSTENGMRIITVVLNADDADKDELARFKATNEILDYVLSSYEKKTILKKGQTVDASTVAVRDGKKKTVKAVAAKDLTVIRPINKKSNLAFKPSRKSLTAPVKKNTEVGNFTFQDKNLVGNGYLGDLPSVSAKTKTAVEKSFFLKVWWNHFVTYVNEKL
ncbi:D-alanyl-D-alanine carboxypeptidase PBP3 [Streptococcus pluranimalium]|uniref:serine-type D-Ala-D-Ala carboxypeptidase n=1 Tax=Streptococcus pluranimalium TaxID=82348 RepID=A0A2L0D262_9STRE|nr:D-alanyl-D-alanine carboxypeptidase PBP3 [Streptococcus pluranimalium]AUW95886.1 D-alanyl-D-alanine carboxypeptidase [Streptococcus pluranimalium]